MRHASFDSGGPPARYLKPQLPAQARVHVACAWRGAVAGAGTSAMPTGHGGKARSRHTTGNQRPCGAPRARRRDLGCGCRASVLADVFDLSKSRWVPCPGLRLARW